jgi:hypothetical protein
VVFTFPAFVFFIVYRRLTIARPWTGVNVGATCTRRFVPPLSVFLFSLGELVHALMRQPQQTSGIARAQLQSSGSQYANGTPSRTGGSAVLLIGLLAKTRVGPDRPGRSTGQLHVIDNRGRAGIVDEQLQRFADAAPSLINSPSLRVATAYPPYGGKVCLLSTRWAVRKESRR